MYRGEEFYVPHLKAERINLQKKIDLYKEPLYANLCKNNLHILSQNFDIEK